MKYRYEIDVQGFASKQGDTESNKTLADDRAEVIASWLRGLGVFQFGSRDSLTSNGNGEIYEANAQS
jgi:outer membrane protein OmpA-like peptidoglycan-associated protein